MPLALAHLLVLLGGIAIASTITGISCPYLLYATPLSNLILGVVAITGGALLGNGRPQQALVRILPSFSATGEDIDTK